MNEDEVITSFCRWLEGSGWTTQRGADFVDVRAERAGAVLYAEAKGETADPGLDVDTLYGQLLRRMSDDTGSATYGVVVPTRALKAALRVPGAVRERLRIHVYEVATDGQVHVHD